MNRLGRPFPQCHFRRRVNSRGRSLHGPIRQREGSSGDVNNGDTTMQNKILSAGAKKSITVGFSQIGAESAWRTAETKSIRSEASKRGVNLKFSDAQQKQENQIKAIGT